MLKKRSFDGECMVSHDLLDAPLRLGIPGTPYIIIGFLYLRRDSVLFFIVEDQDLSRH